MYGTPGCTLITDASFFCAGVAGWAAWAKADGRDKAAWDGPVDQPWIRTSSQAELAAIALGVRAACDYAPRHRLLIQSDSLRALTVLRQELGFPQSRHPEGLDVPRALRGAPGYARDGDAQDGELRLIERVAAMRGQFRSIMVRHVKGHVPRVRGLGRHRAIQQGAVRGRGGRLRQASCKRASECCGDACNRVCAQVTALTRDAVARALYELDPYVAPQEYLGTVQDVSGRGVLQLVGGGAYTWEQALEADAAFANLSFYQPLTAEAYRMADAALADHNLDAALNAMLSADNARMRVAGLKLAEAALHVVREYDGVHRLSLAVAAWATAIAGEGGREERHNPRGVVFPVAWDGGDPASQQVLPAGR